jgi:hypothetical protein
MTVFRHESGHSDSPARTALIVTVGVAVALCSGCGSNDTAPSGSDTSSTHASPSSSAVIGSPSPITMPACDVGRPGPSSIDSVFVDQLPRSEFTVKEICAADVGPGLAGAEVVAELSDLAAAEVTETNSSPEHPNPKVLVGTVKSGNGDAFVDAFLSRVGDTRNDTVTLGGRRDRDPSAPRYVVRYFNTPGGEGYAFAEGATVAIGYIPQYSGSGVLSLASTQEPAKEVFTRIVAAVAGGPIPAVDWDVATERGIDTYAPGRGRYTTPHDQGWMFFKIDSLTGIPGKACGIGPNGSVAGCDMVPKVNVPSGANQTVVDASAPARYTHSDTPTFTRDVDVLCEGHRLDNGDATCGMGCQGTVQCGIGEHSFVVSSDFGHLE